MNLEICVDSIASAIIAKQAGAHRLELCSSLIEGGITPSYSLIKFVRRLDIKLNVLIRPRGGDFLYTDAEFELMKEDIHICGKLKCDGVVIGILHADGTIDKKRTSELIEIARNYNMSVTFHRAFDRSNDLFHALEDIIGLHCDRILTSGGYNTAIEGTEVISKLIKQAGSRIIIMPGAGITPDNIKKLKEETGFLEVHGTFRSKYNSKMQYRNPELGYCEEEYVFMQADPEKIKTALMK